MGPSTRHAWAFSIALAFFATGCAGRSESDTSGNSAGDSGSGGTGASGGASGKSGSGGSGASGGGSSKGGAGGSAGSGAAGGTTPVGGAGGSAGASAGSGTGASGGVGATGAIGGAGAMGGVGAIAGTTSEGGASGGGASGAAGAPFVRECETADDCVMMNDCCGCRAASKTTGGSSCLLPCIGGNACEDAGIGLDELECVAGRCVIDRSCNVNGAVCSEAPPSCPDGLVPSLVDDCFGACLPPTQCRDVTNCGDCADAHCVESEAWMSSTTCVPPVPGCSSGNLCSCLDPCPIGICQEEPEQVTCVCITC
jgi:hypothetical protein